MSRHPVKARAEKGHVTSVQPPPSPHVEDVIDNVDMGCLSKSEFLNMIAQEEGEEIVSDILSEFMTHVMEKCYDVYLKKEIMPFTMAWAENTILQLAKLQHLMHDKGDDVETTSLLQEDTSPTPSLPDSWAEGCVPAIKISDHLQEVQTDTEKTDGEVPQKIPEAQPINKTESPPRKPRRNGRTMKAIPASRAKKELERKPHPPETPSPNKLKPPETQNVLRY